MRRRQWLSHARVFLVEGNLDRETLTRAFHRIIEEDETFRTGFEISGSRVQARVHRQVEFELEEVQGRNIKEAAARFYTAVFP